MSDDSSRVGAYQTVWRSIIVDGRRKRRLFFLMMRRPPGSTLDRSSAASDVYKRQGVRKNAIMAGMAATLTEKDIQELAKFYSSQRPGPVSYTHLRAHETVLDLVCRLLLEKQIRTSILVFCADFCHIRCSLSCLLLS